MANPVLAPIMAQLKEWDAEYRAAYTAATDQSSPKRTEWNTATAARIAKLDKAKVTTIAKLCASVVELAQESEDSAEVMHLLSSIDEARSTVKGYLDSLYVAETSKIGKTGVKTPEQLAEMHDLIVGTFKSLVGFVQSGFTTHEEIAATVPAKWTDGRETKKKDGTTSKSAPSFVWDSPGRLKVKGTGKGAKGPQLRTNSTVARLLVNGEEPAGRLIGEQCKASGIPGFDWKVLGKLWEAAGIKASNPEVWSPNMLTHTYTDSDGKEVTVTLGLRKKA